MKKLFYNLLVVGVVVSIVFMGFGCKAEEVTAPEEEAVEEEAVEEEAVEEEAVEEEEIIADITIWSYPSTTEDDAGYYLGLGEKLKEKFPGINVNYEQIPWDSGPDKVNMAIASGTTPDILADWVTRTRGYASKGLTVSVDDIVNDMKTVPDSVIKESTLDGAAFMVPLNTNSYCWIINTTLAEELGVMDLIPNDYKSWSYDDFKKFLEATKEAGKEDGIYGAALYAGSQSSDSITFGLLMSAGGGDVFNDDGTEITINNPQSVKMLDYLKGLIDEKLVPPGAATMKDEDLDVLFFSKKIVINITQAYTSVSWILNKLEDGSLEGPFDAALLEYPSFEGYPVRKPDAGISGMIVFKNDNDEMKINAAKEFIKLVLSDENLPAYVERWGAIAVDSSITLYEDSPYISGEAAKAGSWQDNVAVNYTKGKPYWSEIRAVFFPEIQAVYSGSKTSQQALDDFVENATVIMNENE